MRHDFNHAIVDERQHRPWPMPDRPWLMAQTWHDLLFAHWPMDPRELRAQIPSAFDLDLFAHDAWIGIVPFSMSNVAPRGVPSMPWLSEFPELNVRTYVRVDDRPGVYFFSLDAASALAVRAARTLLNLPYFSASMRVERVEDAIRYKSRREHSTQPAELVAHYEPAGSVFQAHAGTLEYFLAERYCLYNVDRRGRPYRLDIHHPPWPLQPATARFERNTMAAASGIRLSAGSPLLHFAKRQDMVAWAPERLA
jgi:uncharacterized protein YqjF (DUF2071 family)